ncbi:MULTISPECIES: helix-turn-helix domain-containing protein [Deinococcus]|uniref:Helix-turn-helix domain-containing protein n=1 Tax=Deinococcus rufus TaxID=2136097 RepID=A0ABV7ZBZ3_9DEIO|nr:helix-turn-helix transcriptional regulator [Deinococcus sp. AB2017081]WQE97457.1 helix-turn-helix transcriptional regulator [Deinococcus sp. AB2017081]WQE97480.1 helix-turn-helix transcriptional regulator [Deinococcus sp. AB2017081]
MTDNAVMWRVGDILREHGLTAYKLAAELHGKVNRNSVYAIARGDTERVDRTTLSALLEALRTLTGQKYTVADLLEYTSEGGDVDETQAVLADHPDILERVARRRRGESRVISLEEAAAKHGVKL